MLIIKRVYIIDMFQMILSVNAIGRVISIINK